MSEMQVAYGKYRKSNAALLNGEDEYDAEERLNIQLIDIDGQLYEFELIEDLDAYGFSVNIEPSEEPRFICLWYNGGAGIHEVVESCIRKHINANP